jgi:hypothetical protein
MRFQVLTAENMKMAVFWDVAPRNPALQTDYTEQEPEDSHLLSLQMQTGFHWFGTRFNGRLL